MHTFLALGSPAQQPSQESLACLADQLWQGKFLVHKTKELRRQCAAARAETGLLLSESGSQRCTPIPDAWALVSHEIDTFATPQLHEAASERRSRELTQLADEGFPIRRISRWQSRVGPLHIWPYAGRWFNTLTGRRGKLKTISMRKLLIRELSARADGDIAKANVNRPAQSS